MAILSFYPIIQNEKIPGKFQFRDPISIDIVLGRFKDTWYVWYQVYLRLPAGLNFETHKSKNSKKKQGEKGLHFKKKITPKVKFTTMSERMIADMTQCTLDEITRQTTEIITKNQKVTSIILKRIPLTDDDKCFESVVTLVSQSPHLRSLDLWGCKLNNDNVRRLCWAITHAESNSHLERLNLGYNSITEEGVRVLADCCCQSDTLSKVTTGSSEVPVGQLKNVVQTEGHVKLANLSIGPLSAILVGVIVRRIEGMTSLNVSGNNLRKEGTNFLCRELAHYDGLLHLNIGSNDIFPSGVASIATMLRGAGGGLQTLSLADNNVTNWGKNMDALRTIIDAALDCELLQELRLEGNVLRGEGAAVVSELIASSSTLEVLDLSRCQITTEGGVMIASAISKAGRSSKLKILNLSNNSLGSRGSTPIVEAVCESGGNDGGSSMVELNMAKNNIPAGAAMAMVDVLANNRDDWKLASIRLVRFFVVVLLLL